MTDPIADTITRIRNAQMGRQEAVSMPFSKVRFEISKILVRSGYIKEAAKKGRGTKKRIILSLVYDDTEPRISGLRRISKPGRRIYESYKDLHKVKQGYGFSVISTSRGLLTDEEARKQKIGGEVLFNIW